MRCPVARSMHWYSIGPGFPEHAASTAHAFAFTHKGRGNTVSCLFSGGFCSFIGLYMIMCKTNGRGNVTFSLPTGAEEDFISPLSRIPQLSILQQRFGLLPFLLAAPPDKGRSLTKDLFLLLYVLSWFHKRQCIPLYLLT